MKYPENPFTRAIAKGEKQIGIWASLVSPFAAEVLAPAGYDWALLDMEHAPNDYTNVLGPVSYTHLTLPTIYSV